MTITLELLVARYQCESLQLIGRYTRAADLTAVKHGKVKAAL